MHFTLWPGRTGSQGGHAEITWESFLDFVAAPVVAPTKEALEGWSPARFRGHQRARANVERVSAIVIDDDKRGLPLEAAAALWRAFAGLIHTSHSHTPEMPKYRVVLRASRDMTADEYDVVWRAVRSYVAGQGHHVDEAPKDPSRLWFVPAHKADASYGWCELPGAPIDVDAVLSASDKEHQGPDQPRTPSRGGENIGQLTTGSRRAAMAAALRAAWPARGRHEAQLALAGALRSEGFTEAEAVDFLTEVAGDRPKREATCRHTWSRDQGAPLTGWTRLKAFVDPVVVDAARGALGRGADWNADMTRRLAEVSRETDKVSTPPVEGLQAGPFHFNFGNLNAPLPPLSYLIDTLIVRGEVAMLVAHGGSLKTWVAFSLGLAVATGRPWLGRFAVGRGRAAIIDFESGDYEVRRRLKLLGARDEDVGSGLIWSSYPAAKLTDTETWIALAGLNLELLIVDSFNAANPGEDENDARAALLLQCAGKFANATGTTVIVIHHARKGAGGDAREVVRGSTAIFAACDRIFGFFETEARDGGVVTSIVRSVKDGAGRRPSEFQVELSDEHGLRYIDAPIEPKEPADPVEACKPRIIALLRDRADGANQEDLLDALGGRKDRARPILKAALKQLVLANIVVKHTPGKQVFYTLNRSVEV